MFRIYFVEAVIEYVQLNARLKPKNALPLVFIFIISQLAKKNINLIYLEKHTIVMQSRLL